MHGQLFLRTLSNPVVNEPHKKSCSGHPRLKRWVRKVSSWVRVAAAGERLVPDPRSSLLTARLDLFGAQGAAVARYISKTLADGMFSYYTFLRIRGSRMPLRR